jgi:hypothetical protein
MDIIYKAYKNQHWSKVVKISNSYKVLKHKLELVDVYEFKEYFPPNVTISDIPANVYQVGYSSNVVIEPAGDEINILSVNIYNNNNIEISKFTVQDNEDWTVDMDNLPSSPQFVYNEEYRMQIIFPKGAERDFHFIKKQIYV